MSGSFYMKYSPIVINDATSSGSSEINITTLAETTVPADGDYLLIYDIDAKTNRKITRINLTGQTTLLDSINTLDIEANDMIYAVSSTAFGKTATSSFSRSLINATNQAGARTVLSLTPGTDVQAYSAALGSITDIADSASDNDIMYFSSNILARAPMSSYIRSTVLPAANAAALATAISAASVTSATDNIVPRWDGSGGALQNSGISIDDSDNISGITNITASGTINGVSSTQMGYLSNIGSAINSTQWGYLAASDQSIDTGADVNFNSATLVGSITAAGGSYSGVINMNSNKITNIGTPTAAGDVASKSYVDSVAATGLTVLEDAIAATTATLSATYMVNMLTATSNGAISIDGQSLSLNDRVLVKDQTDAKQNGVYYVATVGTVATPYILTRVTGFTATTAISANTFIFVTGGTINASSSWVVTTAATVDTNDIDWAQFSNSLGAGSGLTASGGLLNVNTVGTAGNLYINGSDQIDFNGPLSLANGGTNASSYTADRLLQFNSGGTAFETSSLQASAVTTLTGAQTLTNKTLDATTNTITADALHDKVGSKISINNTASALNQVLAISSLAPLQAEWATQSSTVDINGLSAITSTDNADELIIYDDSATTNKKITIANFAASIPIALPSGVTIVSASNGDYTTISAAITAVSAGATIVVYPGTYAENLTINKNIRIIGYPAAQNVIISGGDTTTSRVTFTSSCTSGTLRECTVYTPSSGSNYAIDCNATNAGTLMVLFNIAIVGAGAGSGVRGSASGIIASIQGLYHNGGTMTGDFVVDAGGRFIISEVIANVGSCRYLFNISSGSVQVNNIVTQNNALYSCTDIFNVSGGSLDCEGMLVPDDNAPNTNALHITGTNVSISMTGVHLHSSTYDMLIDNVSGSGSILKITGEFNFEKVNVPVAWAAAANYNVMYLDDGVEDDSGVKVDGGGFIVGSFYSGTESVFGQGDSTTVNMYVFTSTDVTDIAGATYVNVTASAKSSSGSTFTAFPALTSGSGLFIGNSGRQFYGFKTTITTALTAGSGILSCWYYNGSTWIEFDIFVNKSSYPYTTYANNLFNVAQGEQVRFHWDFMNGDWATTTVNGQNGYWIYIRIGRASTDSNFPILRPANTNSITTAPILERIKLHTHRTEINEDGQMEFFGQSQAEVHIDIGEPIQNTTMTAGTATFAISSNVTLSKPYSALPGNGLAGQSYQFKLPRHIDTSRRLKIEVFWAMGGTQTGNVRMYLTASINIDTGDNVNGSVQVERMAVNASDYSLPYIDTNIASSASGTLQESVFHLIVPDSIEEQNIVMTIYRDGRGSNPNDTNNGTVNLFEVIMDGVVWTI